MINRGGTVKDKLWRIGALFLALLVVASVAATGFVSFFASPASAASSTYGPGYTSSEYPDGYYSGAYSVWDSTTNAQVFGWCIEPNAASPTNPAVSGDAYQQSFGSDDAYLAFLQWFWTQHSNGYAGYSGDDVAAAIAQLAYVHAGGPVIGPTPPQQLVDDIAAQDATYAGPWTMSITMPTGPLTPGDTYHAFVHLEAPSNTPVSGIPINITSSSGLFYASWPNGSSTDSGGNAVLDFIPKSSVSSVAISVAPNTAPGTTPVLLVAPSGSGAQTLLADSYFNFNNIGTLVASGTSPVTNAYSAYVAKVDSHGADLAGAVFQILNVTTNSVVDTVTTQTTPVEVSVQLSFTDSYQAIEIQAPPGYYIPSNHITTLTPPLSGATATFNIKDPVVPTPTLTTATSATAVNVGTSITDAVTIGGNDGENGVLTATLYGPEPAVANSCSSVDWSAAPTAATQSLSVIGSTNSGDGLFTTAPYTIPHGAPGCYTWGESLTLSPSNASVVSNPGQTTETTLASSPVMSTAASTLAAVAGTPLSDSVVISNNQAESGIIAPSLYGPVAPINGSCSSVSWAGAPVAATLAGVAVSGGTNSGNGDFTTGTFTPAPGAAGCYSWGEVLSLQPSGDVVTTLPGAPAETTLVTSPTLATLSSASQLVAGSSLSDSIVVTDNQGQSGTIAATLEGPVTPINASCSSVNWTGAAVVATQNIPVDGATSFGNGTFSTTAVATPGPGCYTWADTLTLNPSGYTTTSLAGQSSETALAIPTPVVATTTSATALLGSGSLTDTLVIPDYAPAPSATVSDTLLGPINSTNNSCAGASWTNAPVAGTTGPMIVKAKTTVTTSAIRVTAPGCYTWVADITVDGTVYPGTPGETSETTLVAATSPSPAPTPTPTPTPGPTPIAVSTGTGTPSGSGGVLGALVLMTLAVIPLGGLFLLRRKRAE